MITLDGNMFNSKEGIIGGDECVLITPKYDCKWSENNLQFRSMVIRKKDNKIISRGFNKFFNWSEQPDIDKFPDGPFEVIEKMDGSLIIWGVHNNELIHRTRGTFDVQSMDNGHEIHFLKEKYAKFISALYENRNYSVLTEWETRSNVIVVGRVNEPTLTLIGIIDNETGVLVKQEELDKIAEVWETERPERYHYNSISECLNDVESWIGREGVVFYSADGQKVRKGKSDWYRSLHAISTGIRKVEDVIDVFLTSPRFTKYSEFYSYVQTTLDHEIAEKIKDDMINICVAYSKVLEKVDRVKMVVDGVRGDSFTRKDQALEIVNHWDDWRRSTGFAILDNKPIDDKMWKTAIMDCLKN